MRAGDCGDDDALPISGLSTFSAVIPVKDVSWIKTMLDWKHWYNTAFFLLLLIALVLRLSNLHYPINNPEASRDYLVASHIVAYHEYPLMGPWNGMLGGIKNSPLYYYVLAGFLLIRNDIMFLGLVNVLLQLTTGVILYLLAKKMFGEVTGFFAATLFLFSRLNLVQSSEMWQPYLMQPFLNLSFLLMFMGYEKRNLALLLTSIFTFIFAAAIHNSVFVLAPVFFVLAFLIARKEADATRAYFKIIAVSCASFFVWWMPVAISLMRTNTARVLLSADIPTIGIRHFIQNIKYNIDLIFFNIRWGQGLSVEAMAAFVTIMAFLFIGYYIRESRAKTILLFVLFLAVCQTIVISSFIDKPLQPHYFTPLFGILFILIAEQIRWICSRNIFYACTGFVMTALLFGMVSDNFNFIRFGIEMRYPLYTVPASAAFLFGSSPFAIVAYAQDVYTARQIKSIDGVRDIILSESRNIQRREHLATDHFFRIAAYKDQRGGFLFTTDAPFWVKLEEVTHRKLTSVDDSSGNSFESIADPRYTFLVCEVTAMPIADCTSAFRREWPEYLLVDKVYSAHPFDVYLAKYVFPETKP